jgi:hypothetical protein
MSNIKISQLTPKGANLASTDLLEISEFNGSGYETKSITGQEIIDAASTGGGYVPYTGATSDVDLGTHTLSAENLIVNHPSGSGDAATITKGGSGEALKVVKTSGSGNAMSVTGGVTQLDELHLTTDLSDSYIASASTWNAKQAALVSGTNIKTINGSSVLGSGDLTISGGATGIHANFPLASGQFVSSVITSMSAQNGALVANTMYLVPFYPAQTITCSTLNISVSVAVPTAVCRILIYSESNGDPDIKLYESTNIDCSTTGVKSVATTFTFNTGTIYYLCVHSSAAISANIAVGASLMPIPYRSSSLLSAWNAFRLTAAIGSAPSPFSGGTLNSQNNPIVIIQKA